MLARLRKESGIAVAARSTLEEGLGGLWLHISERDCSCVDIFVLTVFSFFFFFCTDFVIT